MIPKLVMHCASIDTLHKCKYQMQSNLVHKYSFYTTKLFFWEERPPSKDSYLLCKISVSLLYCICKRYCYFSCALTLLYNNFTGKCLDKTFTLLHAFICHSLICNKFIVGMDRMDFVHLLQY